MDDKGLFYSAIAAFGAWAAVFGAVLVVWLQNRAARKLACLQLFVQLAGQYDSAEMQRCRSQLARKLLANPAALDLNDTLFVFFENLGVLHRKGLLDEDLLWCTFSIDVCSYWHVAHHFVVRERSQISDDGLYEEFEGLVNHFEARNLRLGHPTTAATSRWLLECEGRRHVSA